MSMSPISLGSAFVANSSGCVSRQERKNPNTNSFERKSGSNFDTIRFGMNAADAAPIITNVITKEPEEIAAANNLDQFNARRSNVLWVTQIKARALLSLGKERSKAAGYKLGAKLLGPFSPQKSDALEDKAFYSQDRARSMSHIVTKSFNFPD